jgi:hypothetical protein
MDVLVRSERVTQKRLQGKLKVHRYLRLIAKQKRSFELKDLIAELWENGQF